MSNVIHLDQASRTVADGASAATGEGTLRLRAPLGHTLGLGLIVLVLLLGLAEALTRTAGFQSRFNAASLGGTHRLFEIQLDRLNTIAKQEGAVDCLILGNLMVWRGFDPAAFEQAYRTQTGAELRCVNFGVDWLPASAAGVLADILVHDYQPRVLGFGTDARDYAVPAQSRDTVAILDMPWVRYRRGQFSAQGWLLDHSNLMRYRGHLRQMLRFDQHLALRDATDRWDAASRGFDPDDTVGTFVALPPDPLDQRSHLQYYYSLLADYQLLPENLAGLEQVLQQQGNQTQVIVLEMPVPPTYMSFFGQGEADYQRFVSQVAQTTRAWAVPFWRTTPLNLISDEGWVDYGHLNTAGARVFSTWLGQRLGEAVVSGQLSIPSARGRISAGNP